MSYRTAWLIKHKLLQAMAQTESDRQLTGRVDLVQTTEDGRAHLASLSARPFTKQAMTEFFATSMGLPLTVVADGLRCFTVAASMGAIHDREVTGGGKAHLLNEKFRAVDTLLSNVQTARTGTYHASKFAKYGYRYLAEVQFRFNRRYDMRAMLGSLLRALTKTPRQPERGIRVARLHR